MYQQSTGTMSELTLDSSESRAFANAISNSGMIVGYATLGQNGGLPAQAGFWTTAGGAVLLTGQYQYETDAEGVNDSGTIVGSMFYAGIASGLPLMWSGPEQAETVLPELRCDHCDSTSGDATAINDDGLIVGSSTYGIYDNNVYVSSGTHAVEWQDGNITDLGALQDAEQSAAYGINSAGDIVGDSVVGTAPGAPIHAFLYHDGTMTDIGTLTGDTCSSAKSINDIGQIVGAAGDCTTGDGHTTHAFLYQGGKMYDLNSLIAPTDPLVGIVTLQQAVSINSNGWIAANGIDSRDSGLNADRAFLLIPSQ